jgi:hypothetical protein
VGFGEAVGAGDGVCKGDAIGSAKGGMAVITGDGAIVGTGENVAKGVREGAAEVGAADAKGGAVSAGVMATVSGTVSRFIQPESGASMSAHKKKIINLRAPPVFMLSLLLFFRDFCCLLLLLYHRSEGGISHSRAFCGKLHKFETKRQSAPLL